MGQVGTSGTGTGCIVGIELVPGTRKGLQRGYMTCPMGQGEVSFYLSQSQWDRFGTGSVPVPLGQAEPVPICLSHWDRLCLSQWLVPVGQVCTGRPSLGSFLIKNQRGPNRILEIPYLKSVSNWSKIETKKSIFFTLKKTPLPKGRERVLCERERSTL